MSEEKLSNVGKAIEALNKKLGKGTVGLLDSMEGIDVEVFPSGSLALDTALGGGYAIGRIIEIYGPESSGKTTLTLHAIAEVQKSGGVAAFIDMEHAFDPYYAAKVGVDTKRLVFTQPDSGDDAWVIIETILDSKAADLIVIDSLPTMMPKKMLQGEVTDANIGLHAKLTQQGIYKCTPKAQKSNCTIIVINQMRDNVGVMYGPAFTTTGGRAIKYAYSQRIEVRKDTTVEVAGVSTANRTKIKVVKNKVAPPFRIAFFDIEFGKGIDKITEVIEYCEEFDILRRGGSWYSYGDVKLGQGKANVKLLLQDNPELLEELQFKLKEAIEGLKDGTTELPEGLMGEPEESIE